MLDIKAIEKKTEARLTDYLGIMEIRDILQQNPATADKEFAILDNMKIEVGVGDDVKVYKAIKNDEGNWELLEENKKLKKESVSYNDLVRAGTDLWRDGCVVYDTIIDGIYDCTTDGHGGYLVDTTIFPELAKYGDKTNVDNVVGFEEDYEALKILWVFPQLIKSEDFKNKLNLDMVLAYDEDKSFAKEFPTMGGNIVMNESASNYYYYEIHFDFTEDSGKDSDGYSIFFKSKENVEDDVEYIWNLAIKENQITEYDDYDYIDYAQQIDFQEYKDATGNISMNESKLEEKANPYTFEAGYYEWLLRKNGKIIKSFGDITENLPEVCNRKNLMDFAEELVYLSDLDTDTDNIAEAIFDGLYSIYGEDLQESKKCVKEEKTKLNFIENVDELPNMCYGVLPSDNSIIIIKKGERGYFLTNKDYENEYADITDWNLRNDKANEICDKLNAELGVTPDQRFTMEIRSMNGNWGDNKIEERNLTRAERYNRNLNRIFDRYNKQIDRYCEFLRRLGYDENRIEKARHNTGLNSHELWDIVQPEAEKLGPNVWSDLNDLNIDIDDIIPRKNNITENHSTLVEESKSIKTESESEYRAVKIIDASEPGVDYGIIMLNKKHSVQDFQNAMWDAYKRNEEQIQEYGDDLSVVLGDIDPTFDWYEIDMDEECLTI